MLLVSSKDKEKNRQLRGKPVLICVECGVCIFGKSIFCFWLLYNNCIQKLPL